MLKDEDLIQVGKDAIQSIPDLKNRYRIIDQELKDSNHSEDEIKELAEEKEDIKAKLYTLYKALEKLDNVEQRIICYRYLDNLSYDVISSMIGYSIRNIYGKLDKGIPLKVGKIISCSDAD